MFHVRKGIKFKQQNGLNLTFCDEYNEYHCYWIEILTEKSPNILLGVCYRHSKKDSIDIFVEKLKDALTLLRNCNEITMMSGDFSYDILNY